MEAFLWPLPANSGQQLTHVRTRCRRWCEKGKSEGDSGFARPNIKKSFFQRSQVSVDKSKVTPGEMNALLVKNGKKPRSEYRLSKALYHSSLVVTARSQGEDELIAMARAVTDGSLNATIWDVLIDPEIPDQTSIKMAIMSRTLTELREMVPGCSVALMAPGEDVTFYEKNHSFKCDVNGVKLMALEEENWDISI